MQKFLCYIFPNFILHIHLWFIQNQYFRFSKSCQPSKFILSSGTSLPGRTKFIFIVKKMATLSYLKEVLYRFSQTLPCSDSLHACHVMDLQWMLQNQAMKHKPRHPQSGHYTQWCRVKHCKGLTFPLDLSEMPVSLRQRPPIKMLFLSIIQYFVRKTNEYSWMKHKFWYITW